MTVHHTPDGYHSVTPYLIVDDAAKALDFYREAFGATELFRLPGLNGGRVKSKRSKARVCPAIPD